MPRKTTKGYFVAGQFVAEGSERDLELKRELRGGDGPSRSERKRESDALQQLGADLLTLPAAALERLGLPDKLPDALAQARRISDFEGRRRQMQYVGKLMRQLDEDDLARVRKALDDQRRGPARETQLLHETETWRTRLLADDAAFAAWIEIHPATDGQQLRALVRQARKDARPTRAGETPRQGKAYRELYQLLREQIDTIPEPQDPYDHGNSGSFA